MRLTPLMPCLICLILPVCCVSLCSVSHASYIICHGVRHTPQCLHVSSHCAVSLTLSVCLCLTPHTCCLLSCCRLCLTPHTSHVICHLIPAVTCVSHLLCLSTCALLTVAVVCATLTMARLAMGRTPLAPEQMGRQWYVMSHMAHSQSGTHYCPYVLAHYCPYVLLICQPSSIL